MTLPAAQPMTPTPASASDRHARNMVPAQITVGIMALLSLLLWTGLLSVDLAIERFLILHTFLEIGSVFVALFCFGIAWHAYAQDRPGNIVLVGAVFLGIGLLDVAHTLTYAGMPELLKVTRNPDATSFWFAARYLAAAGLLLVALLPWRPLQNPWTRHWVMGGVLIYVTLVYWVCIYLPELIPPFFIPGQGLTPLKVQLEYVLVAMYGSAALLFYRQSNKATGFNAADLFAAAAIAALSELFFTRYERPTDLINATGHLYKIVSYYFIYRAVFVDSVRFPFNALRATLNQERALLAEQQSFVRTLNLLEEAVLELDGRGRIVSANSGWWMLMGITPSVRCNLLNMVHAEDRRDFGIQLRGLATGLKDEFKGRFRFDSESRSDRWMECRFLAELDPQGNFSCIRGVLRDITKSYMQERHITHMALHDALTNLPNRVLLEDRIKQAIQQALRTGNRVCVCFIDLDHFKNINDAYEHKVGDALLLKIAQQLQDCLRDGDTLARWGGDEFVVLLPDLGSAEAVHLVAQKMVDAMRQTFELEKLQVNATFSMGIAIFPDDDMEGNIDNLLSQADRAMFYAKSQGRNNFRLFSDMSSKGLGKKELYIQARLAQAIREQQISVWFQPQVAARPRQDGRMQLVGIEALARWHDPDLGWISPSSFIPMAENLGLINELGALVRRQAFEHFSAWLKLHPELKLSINISKRQLYASDFTQVLMDDVEKYGIPPAAVILEVTESVALIDVEFAADRLRQLVNAGFILSIDDFGTGYSSLSQLHELPIGELKIDISFVRRVHTPEGLRIAQGIVSLAKALHLRTVAEGVEDEETAQVMRELGVDLLQGYHFARPTTADELVTSPLFTGNMPTLN